MVHGQATTRSSSSSSTFRIRGIHRSKPSDQGASELENNNSSDSLDHGSTIKWTTCDEVGGSVMDGNNYDPPRRLRGGSTMMHNNSRLGRSVADFAGDCKWRR
ncbi:hypothetical protein NL676_027034 [Syzygium grande]|nr:hypothetical protein NL676_027034 [Syzygium grande]